jgi:hypothetical protein
MDARKAGTQLAIGRIAIGAALIAAPEKVTGGWIGADADREGARVLARALGVRDLVIGVGQLAGLRAGYGAAGWFRAGGAGDVVDLGATLAAGDRIPALGRYGVGAIALTSAVLSAWLQSALH